MKKIITMLLVASLLVLPTVSAFAQDYEVPGGNVEWDGSNLNSNLNSLQDAIGDMQPGDQVTYTVTVKNSGSKDADFWMSNAILQSFEDNGKASDGAYTYYLAFEGPNGTEVFYNSAAVGGDDSTGLKEVPESLEDAFLLGTLSKGDTGTVTLLVALDGETQGNSYQEALAELQLVFGVEDRTTTTTTKTIKKTKTVTVPGETTVVRTGDEFNMLPIYIAALAAGILLVVVATGRRKKEASR